MKNLLNKIVPLYLIFILIIFLIPLVMFLFALSTNQVSQKSPSEPFASPTNQQTPGHIIIVNVLPNPGTAYLPIQPVEFTFSEALSPASVRYEVSPFVDTFIKQGDTPDSIVISPTKLWTKGITKITILETTGSESGKNLGNPYVFQLETALPTGNPNSGNY